MTLRRAMQRKLRSESIDVELPRELEADPSTRQVARTRCDDTHLCRGAVTRIVPVNYRLLSHPVAGVCGGVPGCKIPKGSENRLNVQLTDHQRLSCDEVSALSWPCSICTSLP